MDTVTTARQALGVAWRAAAAYSVDGTIHRALRIWRWPGFFMLHLATVAISPADVVTYQVAAAVVPNRETRPRRFLLGPVASLLGLSVLPLLAYVATVSWIYQAATGQTLATPTTVLYAIAAAAVFLAPIAGPQMRPAHFRAGRALQRHKRQLEAAGHRVVIATSIAAWPMKTGAFSQGLLPQILAESLGSGLVVLAHARSTAIAGIYLHHGARRLDAKLHPNLVGWLLPAPPGDAGTDIGASNSASH